MDRDRILQRFAEWLDAALSSTEAPAGLDAELLAALAARETPAAAEMERRCDSYALWAAMTALSQEVKLQGRAFRELGESLGAQPGRIAEELRASYRDRERDLQREAERRCRKEILGGLIELRDSLSRGLESVRAGEDAIAQAAPRGWLARSRARQHAAAIETLAALRKGYELGLARLDQTLADYNAREIPCQGRAFDPRLMNAVDRQETVDVPEGTVLEVYRTGYEWNGEVFRPAQVKVSCAPAAVERI